MKKLIIYDFIELSSILDEIKKELNYAIEVLDLNEIREIDKKSLFLIIGKTRIPSIKNQLTLEKFPMRISKLIEKINIEFLKINFHNQSQVKIGKYQINLNSREMIIEKTTLKLTEKEVNIILYLSNSNRPMSIDKLQNEVWGYNSDLETHTVETHIYRLRKKILSKFDDDNFIISEKKGYRIV